MSEKVTALIDRLNSSNAGGKTKAGGKITLKETPKAKGWFDAENLKLMATNLEYLTKPEAYCWELGKLGENVPGYHPVKTTTSPRSDWLAIAKESLDAYLRLCSDTAVWTEVKKLMNPEVIDKVRALREGNFKSDKKPDNISDINIPDKQPDSKSDNTYELIEKNEDLTSAIALRLDSPVLGIDTETTGLDPHCHKLRLVQIAAEGYPTLIIDCFKCDIKLLQPLMSSKQIKVFHNAKFDLGFLLKAGLEVNQTLFDTQIAYQLINAGKNELKCSLKDICKELLDIEIDKSNQVSDWMSDELSDSQLSYAGKDAEVLLSLRNILKEQLVSAKLTLVAKIEFDCIRAIASMELNGILLDRVKWQENLNKAIADRDKLESELTPMLGQQTLFGHDINLNSPSQLKAAIKERLGLELTSTSVASLKPHAGKHKAIALLLKYRKVQKSISSFGESLLEKINPVTGRLHPSYWQCGSAAGRFSASQPNLQQVPRTSEVRSCFIPNPGNKLVIADYSQIELRIAAEVSGDRVMIDAYKSGADLHALTASIILNKPLDQVGKEDRQIAKSANFGLLYGAGVGGFQNYAKNSYDIDLSESEAKKIRDNFFKKYNGLAKWHARTNRNLPLETRTMAQRRRVFDEITHQQALNTPIQGTGADILKLALARLPIALSGTGAMILASVHDEIILECPASNADRVASILSEVMVEAGREFLKIVPVEAEASIGDSWADK